MSASTIGRLKAVWQEEHQRWSHRDLSNRRYVYLWWTESIRGTAGGSTQCILVVIGATAEGKKELLALGDGYRESEASAAYQSRSIISSSFGRRPSPAFGYIGAISAHRSPHGTVAKHRKHYQLLLGKT